MHNNKKAVSTLLPLVLASAVAMTVSQSAVAEIVLYDQDDTTYFGRMAKHIVNGEITVCRLNMHRTHFNFNREILC